MTNEARPQKSPWLVPYLTVKDADRALDFYAKAFGFSKRDAVLGEDGKTMHAEMTYKDVMIMFSPESAQGSQAKCPATTGVTSPVTLYVYCEDVDALCRRAEAATGRGVMPPAGMFWGGRVCSLVGPRRHARDFATPPGEEFEDKP